MAAGALRTAPYRTDVAGSAAGKRNTENMHMQHQSTQVSQPKPIVAGDRAVSIETVMARLGCKRTRLYAMIKAGEFPAPTKFGRQSRWSERAIDQWLHERFSSH